MPGESYRNKISEYSRARFSGDEFQEGRYALELVRGWERFKARVYRWGLWIGGAVFAAFGLSQDSVGGALIVKLLRLIGIG